MNSLVQADIFFFITSIAVVAITALLIVALTYAIGILRDAKKVMKVVKAESDLVLQDVEEAREFIRRESVKVGTLVSLFTSIFKGKAERTVKREKKPRRKVRTLEVTTEMDEAGQ